MSTDRRKGERRKHREDGPYLRTFSGTQYLAYELDGKTELDRRRPDSDRCAAAPTSLDTAPQQQALVLAAMAYCSACDKYRGDNSEEAESERRRRYLELAAIAQKGQSKVPSCGGGDGRESNLSSPLVPTTSLDTAAPDDEDSIEELRGCKRALFAVGVELQKLGCVYAWDGKAGTARIELPPNSMSRIAERQKIAAKLMQAIDALAAASVPVQPTTWHEAREWLLDVWLPTANSHIRAWLTAFTAASSVTDAAKMLAAFDNRTAPAREGK